MMKPLHVLLAWELGAGRGHVTPLGAIMQALLERGARVTFAVQRLDALRALRPLPEGVAIVQAPVWPGLLVTARFGSNVAPATFGDILAILGLRDSAVVEFLMRAWDGLFAALAPDVVVTDYAPMADLAARGRIPVVATGNGFSLPPPEAATYPPLTQAKPIFDEAQVLEAVNLGLARCGRAGLDRLPQIGAVDLRCPRVFEPFDPYRATRREVRLPPIMPSWSPCRAGGGEEAFVYFMDSASHPERLHEALPRLGMPVRVYIPNLPEPAARRLRAAGVAIEARPLSAADIARRSRIVISHGGLGLVSMTLAAGLPQLVLALDLEKRLTGEAVMRLGVGRSLRWDGANPAEIVAAARAVAADDAMRDRARAVGAELAAQLSADPARDIAQRALGLVPG